MSIEHQPFGKVPSGQSVDQYILRTGDLLAKIITYGGKVTELHCPDRNGRNGNIVLGFDRLDAYLEDKAFLGTLVGRFANRIANARFTLDGVEYRLPANDGRNTLHGGLAGLDKALWKASPRESGSAAALELRYTSPDGQDGFPGNLDVTVVYTLSGDGLRIDYSATTDKPTAINLTNHSYFNLRGPGSGDVLDHVLKLSASHYTPVNGELIPTGQLAPVRGTVFDFTAPAAIGQGIAQVPGGPPAGYDHNYVLDTRGDVSKLAGRVAEPVSGRVLELYTTEPGVQLYTGNFLDGSIHGLGGAYRQYGAFCLETQHFPDSVHHANFPSTILCPGQTYRQTTVYRMTTDR